ncbi:plasmid mobilization protein [Runella slithyformis]|uniref:Mobilization protein BmgB n=1 Tax=Runella slithyformis (strain ATCC 29530 / DSM 19594 / LMG 11500 / NCIMB 11436 / LSU 4) TaxID=761193 RepID=A0A7U3ZRN0_RUNSL|nr:plasmid mobilization relaxosome protein MobC [Runella slithyformis]AEI52116.1 mobilization protein BmgB [Runella slithyformis DSM 19594]
MSERKKGGRPTLGEHKKGKGLYVSFTEAELELLSRKAGSVGKSKQAYLRELLVKGYVKNIDTAEQQEIKRGLIGLSNNVNQLAKLAHINGLKTMQTQVNGVLEALDELLKKYRR